MPLVTIKNLHKQFENKTILKGINFSIAKGEFVAIMGPSGIGKTTFLNILLGLDKAFDGEFTVHTEKMAAVFQEDRLLPWLSIYDNLRIVNPYVDYKKIKELLELMHLNDFAKFPPPKLSGGMKQRASIARALYYNADLIVMDEPLKSTDKQLSNQILHYLKTQLKKENKSLIMITHDVSNAVEISDYIYILDGKPASFIDRLEVNENNKDEIAKRLDKYADESSEKIS